MMADVGMRAGVMAMRPADAQLSSIVHNGRCNGVGTFLFPLWKKKKKKTMKNREGWGSGEG